MGTVMANQAVGLWAEALEAAGMVGTVLDAQAVGVVADRLEEKGDGLADELRAVPGRAWALASVLGCDARDVVPSGEDEDGQRWEVGTYTARDGTSPETARARVAGLRECLRVALVAAGARRVWSQWHAGRWCRDIGVDPGKWTVADLRRAQAAWAKRGAVGTSRGLLQRIKVVRGKVTVGDVTNEAVASYHALEALMRARPECADMLRAGIHDVVNTLYFLAGDSDNSTREHRATLAEAFDGLAVKDRRTARAANRGEYLVVTDGEADALWDEGLESYLDDSPYVDRERWKRDARIDGRAHVLGRYDGREDVADWGGETYYIYRTN